MSKKKTSKSKKPTAGKAPRTSPSGPPPEAFEALDSWASEVAKCVTQDELGVLLGIYRRIANDKRVAADNRRLAQLHVKALRKFISA